jgi:hypothetical protein
VPELHSRTDSIVENSLDSEPRQGLSESARKFIWDVEGVAFQISYKFAPEFTGSLSRRDRAEIERFLSPDFKGELFAAEQAHRVDRDFAQFQLQSAEEHGRYRAGRTEFTNWLLEQAERFERDPRAQMSLMQLSPIDRTALNGPWKGKWILRLWGEVGEGQPGEVVVTGQFMAQRLPENFAADREWIDSWVLEKVVFARATHLIMEEIAATTGVDVDRLHDNWKVPRSDFIGTPGGVFACDYNQDGITDLLITDDGPALLYQGLGDCRFKDVTLNVGLPWERPTGGIALFADLDNDGDEDLVLGKAVLENKGGLFVRRGYLPLSDFAVGLSVADYDHDGLLDVYVSNSAPLPHQAVGRTSWVDDHSGLPNQLWRNRGGMQFEDVTEVAQAAAGRRSTFTSVWLDANDDGWPDLYVINELGPNDLLINERNGKFSEKHIGPSFDGFAMGVAAGDVDGDGRVDLYIANMFSKAGMRIVANVPENAYSPELMDRMNGFVSGNLLLVNRGRGTFDPVTNAGVAAVGWAYGAALVDLDADGHLDIHSTAGFASFSRDEPDG